MDAQAARYHIAQTQHAFDVLSLLHLTAYLYPPPARVEDESTFDFAIIGGGTAGSVVARRLAEDGRTKVLLIEAGGDPPTQVDYPNLLLLIQNSSVDWKYTASSGKTKNIYCQKPHFDLGLGKMLGGSSGSNYMIYAEGSRLDYNSWAAAVNDSSWNANNVLPYFIKSQSLRNYQIENSPDGKYFGYKGPIVLTKENKAIVYNLLDGFREAGYPIRTNKNINTPTGYSAAIYNIGDGRRQNTAFSYLRNIRKYPNLYVLKNTLATKILFDHNKKAVAIRVVSKNKNVYIYNVRKEIIVSAGAVNTPKLLMLSGIGPKQHLKSKNIEVISDLPVGKNFIDPPSVTLIHELQALTLTEYKNPHEFPSPASVGWISLNGSQHYADYEVVNYFNFKKYCLYYSTLLYGYSDLITNTLFALSEKDLSKGIGAGSGILFSVITNPHPKTKGEVLLRSSNYNDPPFVRSEHNSDPRDLENFVKYIKDFIRVTNTNAFKKYKAVRLDSPIPGCQKLKYGSDDYWKCYIACLTSTKRNFVGTCAMGSVVDKHLYVKGVKGLRVVDASVIPNSLSVAPFASVVMLAEKASDMIKQKYGL